MPQTLLKGEVTGVRKRASAIVSLIIIVVAVVAQAVFIASIGRPGEVVVYVETAIVQLYGSAR